MKLKIPVVLLVVSLLVAIQLSATSSDGEIQKYDTDYFSVPATGDVYDVPSSYDMRDYGGVTSVKDQGEHGSCWTFSTMSAFEGLLIKLGISDDTVDLSELFLAMSVMTGRGMDRITESEDEMRLLMERESFLDSGGYDWLSILSLMDWDSGPVPEDLVPYGDADTYEYDESMNAQSVAHLSDFVAVSIKDTTQIKKMVMDGYQGMFGFHAGDPGFLEEDDRWSYTSYSVGSMNHMVDLVGWDDSFPASCFAITAPGDGAWLVKNSWGEEYGSTGYMWVSYHSTIADVMFLTGASEIGEYDSIYSYDHCFSVFSDIGFEDRGYMANVFTADGPEYLDAVSFTTFNTGNADYSIQIYTDPSNPSDPTSGTPRLDAPLTGHIASAGGYTVDFESVVKLNTGDVFSVVVSFESEGSTVYMPLDTDEIVECRGVDEFYSDPVASAGQSFVSSDGESWTDVSADGSSNVRVKAYTSDADGSIGYEAYILVAIVSVVLAGSMHVLFGRRSA